MGRARTGTQFGLVPVRQDNGVPGQRSGGGESCVFDIGLVYEGQAGLEREQPARRFSEIRAGKHPVASAPWRSPRTSWAAWMRCGVDTATLTRVEWHKWQGSEEGNEG